jgi:putative GTP pyrophosphokinase
VPISSDVQQEILSAYRDKNLLYTEYATRVSDLIQLILKARGIPIHSVAARAKSFGSLAEKITRPDKSYGDLTEITDLAGIRITTYFADDVDQVAGTLRAEFSLDTQYSIDKRLYVDPDRFGYQSLHYVVSLHENRVSLPEYERFESLKCEIQVRSILQHAWAEIEHDLGYKSAVGVPFELRRRFARIAGLFELADDEFRAIRDALRGYEKALPAMIRDAPATVDLDLPSLRTLYSIPSALTGLDQAIVRATGANLISTYANRFDTLLERLHTLGINTVQELEQAANNEMETIGPFAEYWVDEDLGDVDAGIGLFYLIYVLYWRTQDLRKIKEYINKYNIGDPAERDEIATQLMEFALPAASE